MCHHRTPCPDADSEARDLAAVVSSDWDRAYPREQAAFPVHHLRQDKYFPPVGRIDGAAGDRNLICSCPPLEDFEVSTGSTTGSDD